MYKLFLAWRYLFSRKIIFFSIASVAVGVIVLIVVTSVMGGFVSEVRNLLRGISSDMSVSVSSEWTKYSSFFSDFNKDHNELLEKIKKIPHVKACAPRIEWGAMLSSDDNISAAVQIVGIDLLRENEVSDFHNYLISSSYDDFISKEKTDDPPMIIGVYVGGAETDQGHYQPALWEYDAKVSLTSIIV